VFGEQNMDLNLTQLLPLIEEMPAYRQLVAKLQEANGNIRTVVLDAAKPYLIAALYLNQRLPMLVVTAQPENCRKLYEQLMTWFAAIQVKLLPEPDALPYQRIASDTSAELERVQVLSALSNNKSGTEAPLVVTSARAFVQKTTPYSDFNSAFHNVKLGMDVEPFKLLSQWQAMGYRMENIVEAPGTISHRGGIIDIYPPTSNLPARLEFFGNTIDSIRLFDPANQRSLKSVSPMVVGPATELLTPLLSNKLEWGPVINSIDLSGCSPEVILQFKQELAMLINKQRPKYVHYYAPLFNHDSILSYLPKDTLIVLDEPANIRLAIENLDVEAEELRAEKLEGAELPLNFPRPYFIWKELEPWLKSRQCLMLTTWDTNEQPYRLNFTPPGNYAGQLPMFIKKVKQLLGQKRRIILVSHQASRLSELLEQENIIAPLLTQIEQIPPAGSLILVQGLLAEGWVMNNVTYLFTDAEIFGFIKQRRLIKKRPVAHHKFLTEITIGDNVVHIEHGIAKFAGVTTMKTNSTESEYLVLHYAAGDKLYVPTDQIDRVNRYIGASEQPPSLSRLGTQEWIRTRQRVKESVENTAQELLALYAAREIVPGFAFSQDTVWQQELEASFPYVETPDQLEVQQQVKEDMEETKPMDRLVCGDVGYGKTEVSIRAAFKAVMDNKQVAVLVPTTVLAEQHFATFVQRLNAFPIRIEVLSRFRTPKEQQSILDGLSNGSVDICIGTHRLIQKDVAFKDLGLLIIDEEQRFGVAHKEYLKQMRREVDVLTLSATPIPRTLHMALVEVRDMSTMETPPEQRLPIKTYVAEYDERLIREATLKELERNGQIFLVHNRVQSIAYVADKLRSLVPEAKIAVAHGQMPEAELESVMADFTQGKSDILVCTTIIESGLDMPDVNTLIVNKADKFGLTQLYQLRGRVGRGANLAYAYFLYDKDKLLTPTAEKRLRTIFEATELGAGFSTAMKDLEIRGAGNLLGVKQSGHISAVGFSLYCRLLSEAVEEQKARHAVLPATVPSRPPPLHISLPLTAYIPKEYVSDLDTRLSFYQRLVKLENMEEIEALAYEFSDRFGTLPSEVKNLLYAVKIKVLATKASIESIATDEGQIILRRFQGMQFDKQRLEPVIKDGIKVGLTQLRLNPKRLGNQWQEVLEEVLARIE